MLKELELVNSFKKGFDENKKLKNMEENHVGKKHLVCGQAFENHWLRYLRTIQTPEICHLGHYWISKASNAKTNKAEKQVSFSSNYRRA